MCEKPQWGAFAPPPSGARANIQSNMSAFDQYLSGISKLQNATRKMIPLDSSTILLQIHVFVFRIRFSISKYHLS